MGTMSDDGRTDGEERPTDDPLEHHLQSALDQAESHDTRYHLRQALQLVETLDG
jgi:hypothetical protein